SIVSPPLRRCDGPLQYDRVPHARAFLDRDASRRSAGRGLSESVRRLVSASNSLASKAPAPALLAFHFRWTSFPDPKLHREITPELFSLLLSLSPERCDEFVVG